MLSEALVMFSEEGCKAAPAQQEKKKKTSRVGGRKTMSRMSDCIFSIFLVFEVFKSLEVQSQSVLRGVLSD